MALAGLAIATMSDPAGKSDELAKASPDFVADNRPPDAFGGDDSGFGRLGIFQAQQGYAQKPPLGNTSVFADL